MKTTINYGSQIHHRDIQNVPSGEVFGQPFSGFFQFLSLSVIDKQGCFSVMNIQGLEAKKVFLCPGVLCYALEWMPFEKWGIDGKIFSPSRLSSNRSLLFMCRSWQHLSFESKLQRLLHARSCCSCSPTLHPLPGRITCWKCKDMEIMMMFMVKVVKI